MKCKDIEKDILLEQSGELGWLGRRRLARHLSGCAVCQAYRAELLGLARLTATESIDAQDPTATERIVDYARKQQPTRSVEIRFRPSRESPWVTWRPALVYAGFGIVVATMFTLIMRPYLRPTELAAPVENSAPVAVAAVTDWSAAELDSQISNLNSLVAMNGDDWTGSATAETSDDLDAVAAELLAWEGQTI